GGRAARRDHLDQSFVRHALDAACAGLLGGLLTDSAAGPRSIYLVAAGLTGCGLLMTVLVARAPRVAEDAEVRVD
ncbi:hypothetical protein, partial [Amycolatopsis orientalis]|uniref:hypothetical protein n=1 Tax=Amycolatopsis orientalis TaxID=31958 RepID=UPI000569896F